MEDYGVHYVAKMVVHHPSMNEIRFLDRRIHSNCLPENTTEGITEIVRTCNFSNDKDDMVYVDMYGYEHDGIDIMWEDEYEDC